MSNESPWSKYSSEKSIKVKTPSDEKAIKFVTMQDKFVSPSSVQPSANSSKRSSLSTVKSKSDILIDSGI